MSLAAPEVAEPVAGTRAQRLRAPLVTIGALATATAALHFRDPHVSGSWGLCPLFATTGIYCPGCGGLRAVNDLTNGDLVGAAHSNLLFVLALPLIAWGLLGWVRGAWTGDQRVPGWLGRSGFYVGLVLLMGVFMVVRNVPGLDFLTPPG